MAERSLSCFLFPAEGFAIVLPQAVVVEIVQMPKLTGERAPSGWYKGQCDWRSESVVLVSIEELCAAPVSNQTSSSLIAVLHALREDSDLRFYAIELRAMPRSVTLDPNSFTDVSDKKMNCDYVSSETLFENYRIVVPNLKNIERKVQQKAREVASKH